MRSCLRLLVCFVLLACSVSGSTASLSPVEPPSPRSVVVDPAQCAEAVPPNPASPAIVFQLVDGECVRTMTLLGAHGPNLPSQPAVQNATVPQAPTAGEFLDWAQRSYASLFPGNPASQKTQGYIFRYYSGTQMLLGVSGSSVYAMGPLTKGVLVRLGNLGDWSCAVAPSHCEHPVTATEADESARKVDGYSAETSYSNSYCSDNTYPSQWEWNPATVDPQVVGATSGTPLIKHIRNNVVIATYSRLSGGRSRPNNVDGKDNSVGPFRRQLYTQWKDGDVFEVYPAVYEGEDQQIFIGPNAENDAAYYAKQFVVPRNITVRGVTVNGVRPVIKLPASGVSNNTLGQGIIYIGQSENITLENLDVVSSDRNVLVGKAGIYVNGVHNLTLKNIRVSGFHRQSANGIFGTNANNGLLLLQNVELADNGGGGGPEHNIYINASLRDPNFTVKMTGSWSHNSYYGHLFKSRAQINLLEGNYFQGSRSAQGEMRESWLVDIPEGGDLVLRNNIFAKNYSGDSTNGAAVTYGVEKGAGTFDMSRPWALTIEHNTFVTFSRYYDSLKHETYPFFLNSKAPVAPENLHIRNNVFVGYCQTPSPNWKAGTYFGTGYSIVNFNGIDQSFRLRNPIQVNSSTVVGTPGYQHQQFVSPRRTNTVGAVD
ncbi:hypothetical protein [Rhodoferax sp. GW822-FHT02A01]|uniref:hypothetical protein n=1 Tax=Rhodoferax sp. GW822-FHT02A01 TaxID=3141537 RepID=UPI00315C7D67